MSTAKCHLHSRICIISIFEYRGRERLGVFNMGVVGFDSCINLFIGYRVPLVSLEMFLSNYTYTLFHI